MLINTNDDKKSYEIFITTLKKWLTQNDDEKIVVIVQNPQQKDILSKFHLISVFSIFSPNKSKFSQSITSM